MSSYPSMLGQTAELLAADVGALNFALRTRIERGLFLTAKEIAGGFMKQEVSSLCHAGREQIERAAEGHPVPKEVLQVVLLAFELQAILAKLTSTDPYVACDALGEAVPGRNRAVLSFARSLARYAEQSARLMEHGPI